MSTNAITFSSNIYYATYDEAFYVVTAFSSVC